MQNFTEPRCIQPDINKGNYATCKEEFLYNPDTEFTLLKNKPLTKNEDVVEKNSSAANEVFTSIYTITDSSRQSLYKSSQTEAVQMYPQEVSLKLRISKFDKFFIFILKIE